MKKTIFTIAIMAIMLLATSAYNRDAVGVNLGDYAPQLLLTNNSGSADLSKMRGEYVLLTFWSSTDAASRVECNKYSAWVNKHKPSNLNHVAVNFDTDADIFAEIARRDEMEQSAQFNVQGNDASQIIEDFRLADGFGSMLIGPDGRVAKINPSTTELSSLL